MNNYPRRRVRRNRPNRFPQFILNAFLLFLLVGVVYILVQAYPVYIEPWLLHPGKEVATQQVVVQPPRSNEDATPIPTVPVEELPTGPAEDPIQAAATYVPPGYDPMAVWDYNAQKANEYYSGYRPTYPYGSVNSVAGEAIFVGSASAKVHVDTWSWNGVVPAKQITYTAQARVLVSLGFSRESIVRNMVCTPRGDELDCVVKPPSECATFVGIPISGVQPGSTPVPERVGLDLNKTELPAWSGYTWYLDEADLIEQAINEAVREALAAILRSSKLHNQHVAAVTTPYVTSTLDTTFPAVRPIIEDIAVSAACWKISQTGGTCDPAKIHITVEIPPKPDVLQWCGSGFTVANVPYATEP